MIADDYAAIAKAQKALEAKVEPERVDIMEPFFSANVEKWASWIGEFFPHDPVVPPCDSGE